MLKIQYVDGGVSKSLDVLADSFSELTPVFRPFSKYMWGEIQRVFESRGGGAWPKLAEASQARVDTSKAGRIEKIEASRYTSLVGSLRSAQKKAQRKLDKTPASDSKLTERRRKSVARYEAQVAEVQRLAAGGERAAAGNKKLYERVARRDARAAQKIAAVERGDMLGSVANSFVITWDKTYWQMSSEIDWAGAHETGARVGRGAVLPARPFLFWTNERITKFGELAQSHLIERFAKGSK